MDSNNWRRNQGTEPTIDTSDWRAQLLPDSRQRIVNLLMGKLMKNRTVSDPEELLEHQTNAQRFEKMVFTVAKNQSDYLQKISMMLHTVETKSLNTIVNNMLSDQVGPSDNPPDQVNFNLMDFNNGRPNQGTEPAIETSDWRSQLLPDSRQRIVDLLMDTFKKNLPVPDPEESLKLQTNIQIFEKMIFTVATDQSNYLLKISMMMLTVETKSRNTIVNNMLSNQVGSSNKPPDQGAWRAQLPPDLRQKIVNKIMGTLKKHLPVSGPDGSLQIQMIAQRFEEKFFTAATSQNDYLRKISFKMMTLEKDIPSNQVGPSSKQADRFYDCILMWCQCWKILFNFVCI